MPVRRNADPLSVQHVWDAVRSTLQQRQMCDLPRLCRYLQRVCEVTQEQAEQNVIHTLRDKLITCVTKTGQKGTKLGVVTEAYRIPVTDNNLPADDGHDWYCIECHLGGDVTFCNNCQRVFHIDCMKMKELEALENQDKDNVSSTGILRPNDGQQADDGICSVCKMIRDEEKPSVEDKSELNYLLGFTLNRIRVWVPGDVTENAVSKNNNLSTWMNETEITWRARMLLYQPMDVQIMDMKVRTCEYNKLAEFAADVLTIQHNVAVFHGPESPEAANAKYMVNDCNYDLAELIRCIDCYRHSNEKTGSDWFCIPCRPPHALVWAKQKGYPYWPAKVIRISQDGQQYDVRFFGAKHPRSLIDKSGVRSIEISYNHLTQTHFKRSQSFNKALAELHSHQRLLQNPEEVARLMKAADEARSRRSTLDNGPSGMLETPPMSSGGESSSSRDSSAIDQSSRVKKRRLTKSKNNNKPITADNNGDDVYEFHDSPEEQMNKLPAKKKKKQRSEVDTSRHHDHVVSSSTENMGRPTLTAEQPHGEEVFPSGSSTGSAHHLDRVYSDTVEKLHRKLEQIAANGDDKEALIREALNSMQDELDKIQENHAENVRVEMDRMQEAHAEQMRASIDAHNVAVSDIKKKQWCYNCEQEAIYHCCWNTAYCSTVCQQQHWNSEHKKVCRRKR